MGGGLLIPVGQSLTWQLFQPHERAKLSAAVMLVGLLAPACSPAAGGLLVETFSWRGVFLASLPVALVTLALASVWLNDDGPARPVSYICRCWPIRCCVSPC
jgi:MFS family permease